MPYPYEPGVCHLNVEHCVKTHGGSGVTGWMIWDQNPAFAESEFHSVWKSPAGELIDITPRIDGEEVVTFLPSALVALVKHADGTVTMPTNRTTMPRAPYTFQSQPKGPSVRVMYDPATMAKIARLIADHE
jgi:hypothetical protein